MANKLSEAEVIDALAKLLEVAGNDKATPSAITATTGACVYSGGAKTYCAVLSQSDCNKLNGVWTSGGKCR